MPAAICRKLKTLSAADALCRKS